MTCSCNFVFGMQVISKTEFQWNLVIRRVNGRSSKRRGRGFQKRKKWTGNQSTLGLDKLGCGKPGEAHAVRLRAVSLFS